MALVLEKKWKIIFKKYGQISEKMTKKWKNIFKKYGQISEKMKKNWHKIIQPKAGYCPKNPLKVHF